MTVPLFDSRPFVLIVDDNTDHVELIRTALASNYQVLTAFNGLDAYTIACRTPPSAIVLDLVMPIMDGYTVVQKLRANPATAGIPVILLTGADAAGMDDGGKPPDVGAMLTKPTMPGEILAAVRRAISRRPPQKITSVVSAFRRDQSG